MLKRCCIILHLCPQAHFETSEWTVLSAIKKQAAVVWIFVTPPKFIYWNPNVKWDGIRRWGFGRWLGPEGGALMNEINAFIKEVWECILAPSAMWGYKEKSTLTQPPWHRNLRLPAPRTGRNKFLLFLSHLVCGTLLLQLEWTKRPA